MRSLDEIAEPFARLVVESVKQDGLFLAEWERQRIVEALYGVLNRCKVRQEREMAASAKSNHVDSYR